jgi:hypothetical protein
MADIENLLASGSAAPAEPSRHGFWAWKERFVLAHLTPVDPDAVSADGVVAADGDQSSRVRFLWWCTLLELLALVGFSLLLAVKPSTAGPKVYVAAVAVGYTGLAVAAFLGSFLVHLWNSVIEGRRDDQRIIDSLM